MTINLHALVRDFGIRHSGISFHWKQCGILPSYTLVDDIDPRLHPTLFDSIIIAVYNECTPYLSPSYRKHTPLGPGRLCQHNFKHSRLSILVRIMLE